MKKTIPLKYYRFEVDGVGIYEAVDKDCPKDDERRKKKPDGSWLTKAGPNYPESISYWTLDGLMRYFSSGLLDWHVSVVKGDVVVKVIEDPKSVNYVDDDQIILNPDKVTVLREVPFVEFENQLRISEDLIHSLNKSVTKMYKTLGEPSIDQNNPGDFLKKYQDHDGDTNMNLALRNIPTAHRLFYFKDRFVDACFNAQVLAGDIKIESEKVPDEFLKSGAMFALIDNGYIAVKSLLNHLGYFFNIEYLDEDLSELEFINAVDLEDENIKYLVNKIIKSPQWQVVIGYKASKDFGSLSMTRLIPNGIIEDNIKLNMQNRNFQNVELISHNISVLLIKLAFIFEILADYLSENYSGTKGYTRNKDITAATDKKTGYLRRSKVNQNNNKLFKIYNLQIDKPQEMIISGGKLKRSPEYDVLKKSFYRGVKNVSQTISYKKHKPVEVTETVIPENEGDMLWTHTLQWDDYKKADADSIKEKVEIYSLLLSLLTGKAVYTEESKFRHSHKAYTAGKINSVDIEVAVKQALNKIEEFETDDKKSFLVSQLYEYRGVMQNTSFDKQTVDLWSLVDKFAEFSLGNKEYELDDQTKTTLDHTAAKIAPEDTEEQRRLVNAMTREYSLFRRIREYIFDELDLHTKATVDRKEFKRVLGKVYTHRSELTHQSKYSVDKEKLAGLVDYYLFLSNLVVLIFLEELSVQVEYSRSLLLNEIRGFIENPQTYFEDRNKKSDESHKKFQEVMDYLSGKKPLPQGTTTIRF